MATRPKNRPDNDTLRVMLETAHRVAYEGEPVTPEDLDMDEFGSVEEAMQLWRKAQLQKQAAEAVAKAAARHLGRKLGKGGAARLGGAIVRYRKGWSEKCIDPYGFEQAMTHLLAKGDVKLSDVVNPNSVRKTGLPKAVRDTFYEKRDDDEPTLMVVPRDRAPKFLQALEDDEYRLGVFDEDEA